MTLSGGDNIFSDRRKRTCRRSVFNLVQIGVDRRRVADRRDFNRNYVGAEWWLQVDYFDGHYKIKPGAKNHHDILKSNENLLKL